MYEKLRYWIKNNANNCLNISMNNIKLIEDIHKTGNFVNDFNTHSKLLPLVVRKVDDNSYTLVANWKAYKYYEYQSKKSASCIVINQTRDEFFKMIDSIDIPIQNNVKKTKYNKIIIKLNKIVISKEFKRTKPKQEKIDKIIQIYNIKGSFDKHIVINKNKLLIDGYARYIAAMQLGLKSVEVMQQMN